MNLTEIDLGGDGLALTPAGLKSHIDSIAHENIIASTRMLPINSFFRIYKENVLLTNMNSLAVDGGFEKIFAFNLKSGTFEYDSPNTIILSESKAEELFGGENSIGKQLLLDGTEPLTVTGVFDDLGANTHLEFDSIISLSTIRSYQPSLLEGLRGGNFYTYVSLEDSSLISDYLININRALSESMRVNVEAYFQPLRSIHLSSNLLGEMKPNGSLTLIVILISLSALILLISSFNFFSVTTAYSSFRSREVGVRKIGGASNNSIFIQFFLESFIIISFSAMIALAMLEISKRALGDIYTTNTDISFMFILVLISIVLLMSIIAAIYPALVISRFSLLKALNGEKLGSEFDRRGLKNYLLAVQCGITVVLLSIAMLIGGEILRIQSEDIGYDRENVYVAPELTAQELEAGFDSFREELLQVPGVLSVSAGEQIPTMAFNDSTSEMVITGTDVTGLNLIPVVGVHYGYAEVFSFNIHSGRDFTRNHSSDYLYVDEDGLDRFGVIVTDSFVKQAGLSDGANALGQTVTWADKVGVIVGVVSDVRFSSPSNISQPIIFALGHQSQGRQTITFRHDGTVDKSYAERLFDARFGYPNSNFVSLSDRYSEQYYSLYKQIQSLMLFTGLMLLLTLLGIFALSKHSADSRIKEIVIRRVLGASSSDIVKMLTITFMRPITVAILASTPVAYIALNYWANAFLFEFNPFMIIILISILVTLFITSMTVSAVSAVSAMANPAKSLNR